MKTVSNEPRDPSAAIISACWPPARLGEALRVLARHQQLPAAGDTGAPPPDLEPEQMSTWLEAAAEHIGLQADRVPMTIHDVAATVSHAPPLLLRLQTDRGAHFLAITRGGSRTITAIGPDLRPRRLSAAGVCDAVRRPIDARAAPEVERFLERIGVAPRRRRRARALMIAERLAAVHFGGCWVVRPRIDGSFRSAAREARLAPSIATLTATQAIQSALFLLSWWLLGRTLISGTVDRGWLLGWLLLLLSLVPFRLSTSWLQGRAAMEAGTALRRRLLRGGLSLDRQRIREKGAGQFFGLIVEGGLIESLAVNGGVAALLSTIELSFAVVVLWFCSGALPVALLFGCTAGAGWIAYRYVTRRRAWTDERLDLSHLLLENMVGHRTRLAQQPPDIWHEREDALLERYSIRGAAMDRSDLWLAMAIPRGWLVVALTMLVPLTIAGAPQEQLAVLIGGTLLAYRALRRLVGGLGNLAAAAIAARLVAPVVRAESCSEAPSSPSLVLPSRPAGGATSDPLAAHARNVAFRYRSEGEPVLWDCSMKLPHGARLLLDGPSGSGKTTFASILAGLSSPDSGSVLADGLDRRVLGAAGWRSRVVMAPQPHHNYILGGSLAFNLLMGRRWPARDADLAEAEELCRELGLGDLLDRMPAGLWQMVGETGWQLSQGERTRVFLARALLQRSNVLILDESFGALDPENLDRALRCVQRRAPTVMAIAHA